MTPVPTLCSERGLLPRGEIMPIMRWHYFCLGCPHWDDCSPRPERKLGPRYSGDLPPASAFPMVENHSQLDAPTESGLVRRKFPFVWVTPSHPAHSSEMRGPFSSHSFTGGRKWERRRTCRGAPPPCCPIQSTEV